MRSEDLSTQDAAKLEGNVPHCTITTVAESPFDPNKVLVGTDDGLVHLTEDGCLTFTNLAGRFPGVPSGWWVNRVEFSAHDAQRAWVVFSGYREDDFRPFVYTTGDGGQSWKLITRGLHQAPVNVIREDPFSGHLFVFRNRRRDRLKVLWWDRDGLAIFYKRLESGSYQFPMDASVKVSVVKKSPPQLSAWQV